MREATVSAQYLQIALDIARRISRGELPEGSRLYGRSIMASEYSVSPETIRRALHLLADMKVVAIKQQSGTLVLSADSARRYIENFSADTEVHALREQLKDLMEQYAELNRKTAETVAALIQSRDSLAASSEPFPNYEVPVPENSPLLGKSIGELRFWQSTGATIIAIRRGGRAILSPGPYAELFGGDIIVLAGTPAAAEAVRHFVTSKEDIQHDPV